MIFHFVGSAIGHTMLGVPYGGSASCCDGIGKQRSTTIGTSRGWSNHYPNPFRLNGGGACSIFAWTERYGEFIDSHSNFFSLRGMQLESCARTLCPFNWESK